MSGGLSRPDERWLLGSEYARMARRDRRTVKRASRWQIAAKALPSPVAQSASRHVTQVFYLNVLPRLEKEGWHGYCKALPKQEQWWYSAAAALLAQGYAENHVKTCQDCSTKDWDWLLSVPVRTPRDTEFDITGNVKPTEEES